MSELLDIAIARVKSLSPSRQDEIATYLLDIAEQETATARLSPEQVAEVKRRVARAEPPVSEAEATSFFSKFE